jgi:probable F420-dependent oxidoreductase
LRIGLYTLATDESMPFHLLAQEAEQRGFDILFTGEHSHIPVGAKVWSGGDVSPIYRHVLDPFAAIASAATATSKIKLGTAICLLALHDPIRLAKLISSVDWISQGRFVFGIGYGYIEREMTNHGVDHNARKDVLRDKIRAMQKLWTDDIVTYGGPYVSFVDVEQYPKPFRRERPPILIGAKLRGETIRDMIEFGDGWLPTTMMGGEHLVEEIARFKREWTEAGRDGESVEITVLHTGKTGAERREDNWGAAQLTEEIVNAYEKAGAKTLCVPLPPKGDRDVYLRNLDEYAKVFKKQLRT